MDIELFKNRDDASNQLLKILPLNKMQEEPWIVLASSSGAVSIALKIAEQLNADFDFIFTYKINTPKNDECEVAIITETKDIIIHEELMKSFKINLDDIYQEADKRYDYEIQNYIKEYRDGDNLININLKNVLIIDEGLNTGLTMMACIKSIISSGAKSIAVAVPILPEVTIHDIESIADDLYFIKAPAHFVSIDFYYEELEDITLKVIKNIIKKRKNNVNSM
jgi:putative phosphoribosyl transferase